MSAHIYSFIMVALGGAAGSAGRYGVSLIVKPAASFPFATLSVNLVGSFLIGLLFGWLMRGEGGGNEAWRLFLGVGVLGGFTTFSAFSWEFLQLIERREIVAAFIYGGGSLLGGLVLVALGFWLSK